MKRFLFIIQQVPYGNSSGLEALELAMGLSAFEQSISLWFRSQGILHLLNTPLTDTRPLKAFTKGYGALEHYDIEDIYCDPNALTSQGVQIEDLCCQPTVIEESDISTFLEKFDAVISV